MSMFNGKLLEFKAIKKESDKTFLQVILSFEEDLEIYMEIDEFTGKNISNIIDLDEKYKYRLSFVNYFDTSANQHVSRLTKTYLDNSHSISFLCSEKYINILSSIKGIEDIDELDKLDFIARDIQLIHDKPEPQVIIQDVKSKTNIRKSPRLIFFSLSAVFIMLLSYLNFTPSSEATINKEASAESIQLYNEMNMEEENLVLNDINFDNIDDNIVIEDDLLIQPIFDFIELDQTVTYSLPIGNVALTFDDGPSQYSREIADILKEYGVGGTFFYIGQKIDQYADSVKYVQSSGHSIGSHSINHSKMPNLSYANQEFELVQSMELIKEITNGEINLFRPPYGAFNRHLEDLIVENNYKMVLWDNDPEDWKNRDSNKIFYNIKNHDVSGSIILLHESQAVVDALPVIIEYLQELDLKIVSLR